MIARPDRMTVTPERRIILDLAAQGLSVREIARRLGVQFNTAKWRLDAARRAARLASLAEACEAAGWPPQTPIEALPLGRQTLNPLLRGQVETLEQLRAFARAEAAENAGRKVRICSLSGMGAGGLDDVDQVLAFVSQARAAA